MADFATGRAHQTMEEWEDSLLERYPAPHKKREEYRNYEANSRPSVREFYRLNHISQTLDFVRAKKAEYLLSYRHYDDD